MEQWIEQTFGMSIADMDMWVRIGIVAGIVVFAYLVDLIFSKVIVPIIR